MDSTKENKKETLINPEIRAVEWADLPPELLAIIIGGLKNPRDTVRFRSVCRSWRFSTPSPANKLSPFVPHVPPLSDKLDALRSPVYNYLINATAVYIIRSRSDPSMVWMVAVQEAAAGILVLRDALFYKEIDGGADPDLDPDWIVATQTPIARSYAHNARCLTCNGVDSTNKVEFVFEPDFSLLDSLRLMSNDGDSTENELSVPGSGSGSELLGIYAYTVSVRSTVLLAFWYDLFSCYARIGVFRGQVTNQEFHDFVKFNGRFYAVDKPGLIYFIDPTDLEIFQMTEISVTRSQNAALSVNFVVSDGDLFLVWRENRSSCQIYKLVVVVTDDGNKKKFSCDGILIEKVEDLGDKVFFVTPMWCFSISAKLLPHPWQANRIFFSDLKNWMCKCARNSDYDEHHEVFDVGAQTFTRISSLQGYSDLFSLPASFVVSMEEPINKANSDDLAIEFGI